MDTGLFIAFRYLFAKKSHNVINVISAISAVGIAVGAAALVLILSVYNGFDRIIRDNISDLTPDILIGSSGGGLFVPEGAVFEGILEDGRIGSVSSVLEADVLVSYGGKQGAARAKGVDRVYEEESPLASHISSGEFSLHRGDVPLASVGSGLAYEMGISPRFLEKIRLYYPKSSGGSPLLGPSSALGSVSLVPGSIFSVGSGSDASLMIVPLELMRGLVGCSDGAVSGVELRLCDASQTGAILRELSEGLGPEFSVRDRYMQNSSLYRMMKYEKLAVFLILIFVVIIVAFNIFGSLSMLIIEKREDIGILSAMGAKSSMLRRIFLLEGWMISLLGLSAGLVAGVGLALLQQHFGLIKMPQGFFVTAYPVELQASDVALTAAAVTLIGFAVAFFSSSRLAGGQKTLISGQ